MLILHGSAGVDSRGDFYARALNAAGIATLEIDYWEARGGSGTKLLGEKRDVKVWLGWLERYAHGDLSAIGEELELDLSDIPEVQLAPANDDSEAPAEDGGAETAPVPAAAGDDSPATIH